MSGAVAWEQLAFMIAAIFTVAGVVLALAWFLWQRIAEVRSRCFTEMNTAQAKCTVEISAVSKELNDFKLKVIEEYVKRETLSDAEVRVGRAIADLKKDFGDRLDERFNDMKDLLIAAPSVARKMRK